MSKYDYGMELPPNGSIRWGFDSVPENSKVLEMGCSHGLLTAHLKMQKNCVIDIVEIDEKAGKEASEFANLALIGAEDGNLELEIWKEKLDGNKYDVITFLDVLEHLRNPEDVLKHCASLLKEDGIICVSVPNIGHNAVLVNLLNNKFKYQNLGILDSTHVRFFCQDTLEELIDNCGFVAIEKDFTQAPVGDAIIENSYTDVNPVIEKNLKLRENGELFQFLYKLHPKNIAYLQEIEMEYTPFTSVLYYDIGGGFNETHALKVKFGLKDGISKVIFDTSELENVIAYRWDPVDFGDVVVKVNIFKVGQAQNHVDVQLQQSNALFSTESGDVFRTSGPNYLLEGNVADIKTIEIEAEIRTVGMDEIDSREETYRNYENKIKKLKTEYKQAQLEHKAEVEKHEAEIEKYEAEYKEAEHKHNDTLIECNILRHEKNIANQQVVDLNHNLAMMTHQYNTVANSATWRCTKPIRAILDFIKRILRKNKVTRLTCKGLLSLKRNGYKATKEKTALKIKSIRGQKKYGKLHSLLSKEERVKQSATQFSKDVKFSIVVPLYNTPKNFLVEMIESVQKQTYQNWELCMADGSDYDHTEVGKICQSLARKDNRIKYKKLEKNLGISENTNACLEMATGNYIGLFDHDDLLHPAALFEMMKVICERDADFIYTDEQVFEGKLNNIKVIHFKSDFAIDTLRSVNYICHFTAFKKELLDVVGMFNPEVDGSQDYDIILRLTEKAEHIVHIPKILYYWRVHKNSVASDISAKPYTMDAAKKALAMHLERCGLEGEVVDAIIPSMYRIKYKIQGNPKISIIIPNKDYVPTLKRCIDSIVEKSTYRNFEIIVVENNSTEDETFRYYDEIGKNEQIKVVYWKHEFNYSKINNFGFEHCTGEYILLLNNDVEVLTPDWLQEMLMFTQRSEVGATGAMMYYPNDTIQHAGIIVGIASMAGHSHRHFNRGDYGYMGRLTYTQNLSGSTAACLMIRRNVYEEINGLDEMFVVALNDVDLCLRIREAGYLTCWTPYAELYHYESTSRGYEDTPEKQARFQGEVAKFQKRWGAVLEAGDPYYNKNLTLDFEDFRFK